MTVERESSSREPCHATLLLSSMSLYSSMIHPPEHVTPINQSAAVHSIIYSQPLVRNDMRGYTSSQNNRSHPTLTHLTPQPHTRPPRHLRLYAP